MDLKNIRVSCGSILPSASIFTFFSKKINSMLIKVIFRIIFSLLPKFYNFVVRSKRFRSQISIFRSISTGSKAKKARFVTYTRQTVFNSQMKLITKY